MSDTPTPAPVGAPRKASRKRMLLMLVLGGLVLAGGGCALFLANLNINGGGGSERDTLSAAGAIIFIGGVIAIIVGILWALARWIDRRFDKSAAQDASTPGAPKQG